MKSIARPSDHTGLIIRPLGLQEQAERDAYVTARPDGTFFHLSAWQKVVDKSFGHPGVCLGAFRAGSQNGGRHKLAGVMPVTRIKSRLFGDFLVSIPFAEVGGAVADDAGICAALSDYAAGLAETVGCDYLEMRNRAPMEGFAQKSLYYNFSREIYPNLDDNMSAIKRKARRMIRVGEKAGLYADWGRRLFPEFYEIMAINYHRLGTPIFPKHFFRTFLEVFGKNATILLIREKGGKCVAGVLTFFFRDRVMPYYAGSDFDYRRQAPNDFMYWELMRFGCENGYRIFDFGRSKENTGSFHFKRHWGFEPEPLAYQYHLVGLEALPNLSPANPKYKKKVEMWQKLPFIATKLLGPPIARYLA